VIGYEIVLDLHGPFFGPNGAQPLGIAGHCRAFARWSPGVIGCSPLQGLATLTGQLST
jgi:hypothetical protein